MEKKYKNCQSCAIPLRKDPEGGGTNADGTRSGMYCSYCYKDGAFTWNCTVSEMQEFCKGKLMEMHFPGFVAGLMVKGIPNLERWKKN